MGAVTIILAIVLVIAIVAAIIFGVLFFQKNSALAKCNSNLNCTVPTVVTGMTATPVAGAKINVAWTAVTGATSYKVYLKLAAGATGPYVTTGDFTGTPTTSTTTSTTLTVVGGSIYSVIVTANNTCGEGPASAMVANIVALL
jgi:hypothetical protein